MSGTGHALIEALEAAARNLSADLADDPNIAEVRIELGGHGKRAFAQLTVRARTREEQRKRGGRNVV